ncbi:hypothetical protein IscW_ISCW017848 [Ixodes scapularis]|uniref:Uncharacterized protein n=1 Tax=Ixodes scapularis TaxID=6945 RepID=B7PIP4_IXOSC|nr:hypothetical protein IscW_ISCW017848 [Ixodes scapularis]|eukprot:XP_002405643.1 hypothetical protein IscW_ISCW017848 [Ixodes scapularis]
MTLVDNGDFWHTAPPKRFDFSYERLSPTVTELSCEVDGVFPLPTLFLYQSSGRDLAARALGTSPSVAQAEGAYKIRLTHAVDSRTLEAGLEHIFECVLSIPETNFKRQRRLEFEPEHSCLEEQAKMLVSDNKHFQQLPENLKQARHCLEEELKTQREQHVKATKEMENEHCTALYEAAKCEAALSALKTDHSQLLDKYNHIVYRHRNLQEEFHAAAQEKRSLEDRFAQPH